MISKVLIAGSGSIATRHANNLISLGINTTIFTNRENIPENQIIDKVNYTNNFEAAVEDCEAVIIANRTDLHIALAIYAAEQNKNILIEKPLSNSLKGIDLLERTLRDNSIYAAPGFMLRFHPNIIFIKQYLEEKKLGKIHYARALVGQYLPDWRPNSDYKKGYGAKVEYGGGVILDLIHEIDLCLYLFGNVSYINCLKGKTEELEIDTESMASITFHSNSNVLVNIFLDYVRPVMARNMEIVGENGILTWNFVKGEVNLQSHGDSCSKIINKVDNEYVRNNMYVDEIKSFLKIIDSDINRAEKEAYFKRGGNINDAIQSLKVALLCHQSSDNGILETFQN